MKTLTIFVVLILCLYSARAERLPETRTVRLLLNADSNSWTFAINGTNSQQILAKELTNAVSLFHLGQGDLILVGNAAPYSPHTLVDWGTFFSNCQSNKVAIYLYSPYNSAIATRIFSIPIYSWQAPFENPRDYDQAVYFKEGKYLGRGNHGFKAMLNDMIKSHKKQIFVLGSAYSAGGSFGPVEHPFEREDAVFQTTLEKSGVTPLMLEPQFE